ncbi:hypothetical protein ACF049_13225 [Cellulosimicrobium funkei]|uniref:hypothetical protein n=1 Tax=Cellulosimicrobium funkei TaxID=264251 RepID=UPI0036FDFDB7
MATQSSALSTEATGARWTPEEYAARFRYSKNLREIVTESGSDCTVYRDFLASHDVEVQAIPASRISVERATVLALGMTSGVKHRLLTLGHFLTQKNASTRCVVVVDRDYDEMCGVESTHVFMTDWHSVEMYAYNADAIARLAKFVGGQREANGVEIIRGIEPAVTWLGAARTALAPHGAGLLENWLSYLDVNSLPVSVRERELIGRSVAGNQSADVELILAEAGRRVSDETEPVIALVRGHDFTAALKAVLTSRWARQEGIKMPKMDLDQFEGTLLMSLTPDRLRTFPLFQALLKRFSKVSS